MVQFQREFSLPPFRRGFHPITSIILEEVPEINKTKLGVMHIFIKHTSASLTINESADSSVATDMEKHFNKMVPENMPYYDHTYEGPDDMPAHIKGAILGSSVTIPITNGKLNLGIWQGVFLCEHRNYGGSRKLVVTIY